MNWERLGSYLLVAVLNVLIWALIIWGVMTLWKITKLF